MDSQLKQRLIGAAVLVALAVIFLPMLVKGPAPDSGVSDVPLNVPDAPGGTIVTRDLPLVVPDEAPAGGATGMPAPSTSSVDGDRLPTVDTASASNPDAADLARPNGDGSMLPASVAGGDYAVHVGAYASSVSADTVVSRLRGARLPASSAATEVRGAKAWRVSVGPYATRADAETARIEVARATGQSTARVIALDANADAPAPAVAASSPPAAVVPAAVAVKPEPIKPAPATPEPSKPDASKPDPVVAKPAPVKPVAAPTAPAASSVGFAVQIGAFSQPSQATAKRDQLRAAGFSAFTETVNTEKGTLTRVLAGPVVSRAEADRMNAQIAARLGAGGMVRAHP